MSYLLDTCVLSEFVKKKPNEQVVKWFNQQQPEQLFVSSIAIAEIKKGLYKIRASQPERFQTLTQWLNKLEIKFTDRVLPLTDDVLDDWAEISAYAELQGQKLATMDSLIAATAHRHKLVLVTRNIEDFNITSLQVLNPYGTI
jgi:predicted nucleic acid-binding protein